MRRILAGHRDATFDAVARSSISTDAAPGPARGDDRATRTGRALAIWADAAHRFAAECRPGRQPSICRAC